MIMIVSIAVQKMASWLRKQCSRFFGRAPGSSTASLAATRNTKEEAKEEEEELWLAAFRKMDTSGDMHVEVSELREWFVASPLPAQMSYSDFLKLMMAKDGDYDGKLSFHEWKMTMLHFKKMGELKSKLRDPLFALKCGFLVATLILLPMEVLSFEVEEANDDHLWSSSLRFLYLACFLCGHLGTFLLYMRLFRQRARTHRSKLEAAVTGTVKTLSAITALQGGNVDQQLTFELLHVRPNSIAGAILGQAQ
jgi:hypothetical protein